MRDAAVNINPENHLVRVFMADVSDETNLLSSDVRPVFTEFLFNLQQLMSNAERGELGPQFFGVIAVVLVRCVERTDDDIARAHLEKFTIALFASSDKPHPKATSPRKVHGW